MKKIAEIREEIGVYNKTLNNYIRTFGLIIFNKNYLENWNVIELRDTHIAKPKLLKLFLERKEQIKEFESDYYKWKSPMSIAVKLEIHVDSVLKYLNRNISSIEIAEGTLDFENGVDIFTEIGKFNTKNTDGNRFTLESQIKHISSYQILKEIQKDHLNELIDKHSK